MGRKQARIVFGLLTLSWLIVIATLTNPPSPVSGKFATPNEVSSRVPAQPYKVQALPDLIIQSITYTPSNPQIGQSIDITVTVKNQGTAAASGFYVHLFVNPSTKPPAIDTTDTTHTFWGLPLNAGATFTWTRTGQTFSQNGTYPVYAWVDRANSVSELIETNNLSGAKNIIVGAQADLYEPDNACGQATLIPTDGTDQDHNLVPAPDDMDWVKFNVVNGVSYRVQGIADGGDADLELSLMSSCDTPPSFSGAGQDFTFTAPTDGIIYLKVQSNQPDYGSDSAYRIRITAQNDCSGFYEPNDSCAASGEIGVGETAQVHNFCRPNDSDWISFQTEAGSSYRIDSTNIGSLAHAQSQLNSSCTSGKVLSSGASILYTSPKPEILYLKVTNQDGQVFGADTNYSVSVSKTGSCNPDAFEADDTINSAKTIQVGGASQEHNTCSQGDTDWAKFTAVQNELYTIETFQLGADSDTNICLYDVAHSAQLLCDDDGGDGKGSRIVWTAPAAGEYAIRTLQNDATVAGPSTSYNLRVTASTCDMDGQEPDNDLASANTMAVNGAPVQHNICPAGDADWVKIQPNPGPYLLQTSNLGPEADTVLELYDQGGKRITANDDYTEGRASRITYTFLDTNYYYLKVSHRNHATYGLGTEYSLEVKSGTPTATPTQPTPAPTLTPTSTPVPSEVKSLVLINKAQVARIYDQTRADNLLVKVQELAANPNVKGDVIRLDLNDSINQAYQDWNASWLNVEKANQVTVVIRQMILAYLQEHKGVEYIVLVGGDPLIPFRRILDNTPQSSESQYILVNNTHPTGAALRANFFLSDNYYADIDPARFEGRNLYIPDLAIGRLIETPEEMIEIINTFLAGPSISINKALVTGYDFVQDAATDSCTAWKARLGAAAVNCEQIGDTWSADAFRNNQLNANPPFTLQSINGHADHFTEGVPGYQPGIIGTDILVSPTDLSRALIYTLGCHSGLNVPESNTTGAIDLAQAFLHKKANYVANTGYGWGLKTGLGLEEKLISLYTKALLDSSPASMGKALSTAKQQYYLQATSLRSYDEKVLEELTFYGLPMYQLNSGSSLGITDDPFPSIQLSANLPSSFGTDPVVEGALDINLASSLPADQVMSLSMTGNGNYFSLDGSLAASVDQPFQPLFFGSITVPDMQARSIVWLGGEYEPVEGFQPLVAAAMNENISEPTPAALDETVWYPALPVALRQSSNIDNLVSQFGQYNPDREEQRLFNDLKYVVYYSNSSDQTPPVIQWVDAVFNPAHRSVEVKIDAVDESGVMKVLVTYSTGNGHWQSVTSTSDPASGNWLADLPANHELQFFVQAVDRAGNVAASTNKNHYFTAPLWDDSAYCYLFLPLIIR